MLDEHLLVIGEDVLVEVPPPTLVEVECLRLRDGGTGVGLPIVDTSGANSIIVVPQANLQCEPSHIDAAADVIIGAEVVLAQLELPYETVAAALSLAKKSGRRTILNPAPMGDESLAMYRGLVDLVIPNEAEAAAKNQLRRGLKRDADARLQRGQIEVGGTLSGADKQESASQIRNAGKRRSIDCRIDRVQRIRIEPAIQPVVTFGRRHIEVPAEPEVQCQAPRNLPVVLNVGGEVAV